VSRIPPEDGVKRTPAHARGAESATYREVLANGEYRALFSASLLSWIGDNFSKAAITALVFAKTGSPALSAAAFALSFLPWLAAGPLLAALAERYPYRNVIIVCDLVRMVLIAGVALRVTPLWAMLVLLFLSATAAPPAQAAKSAMLPQILEGDRLPVGIALNISFGQVAQVLGYLGGGLLVAINPRDALLLDSLTFLLSAALVTSWVRRREPAKTIRRNLFRETGDGFRMVFSNTPMRSLALLVFSVMLFSTVPEGLAAAWVGALHPPTEASRGLWQGVIMMSLPVGAAVGALLLTRMLGPTWRRRLLLPFAMAVPAVLLASLLRPNVIGVAVMTMLVGVATAGVLPTSNALFVRVLPNGYRARAFGVMQMGTQLAQGAGIFIAGMLAERVTLPIAVGVWGVFGVLVMVGLAASWPSRIRFDEALQSATPPSQAAGPTASGPAAAHPVNA